MSKNHLAAIHIAFKALGINKDDACALKQSVTGVASAADMTEQQRKRLLARLAEMQADRAAQRGEQPAYTPKPRPAQRAASGDLDERWFKARALWASLAAAGHVHTDTDAALTAYVKRQTKLEHWRFLNGHQVTSVIEALKRWCRRVSVATEPAAREVGRG
ncbi:MAG: regulatory protein GemA [Pseudomonadota bacterium]